jgi:hypothetical protein
MHFLFLSFWMRYRRIFQGTHGRERADPFAGLDTADIRDMSRTVLRASLPPNVFERHGVEADTRVQFGAVAPW